MKKKLIYSGMFAALMMSATVKTNAQNWLTTGNGGSSTQFLGTTAGTGTNFDLRFRTNNAQRMVIKQNGRVGIGTGSPTNRLTVFGGTTNADTALTVIYGLVKRTGNHDIIAVEGASQPAPGFGIGVLGTGNWVGTWGNGGSFGVVGTSLGVGVSGEASDVAQVEFLTGVQGLTTGGDLCVGVFGNSTGAVNNYGVYGQQPDTAAGSDFAIVGEGDVIAWRYFVPSDRKLKNSIQSYTGALEKIQHLTASTYRFNQISGQSLPGGKHIGFMADEVENVFPELIKHCSMPAGVTRDARGKVTYHAIPDVRVVNYIGLIPVLAEAIKEQKQIVDAKDAQIADLNTRLTALEARLSETSSAKLSSFSTADASLEQNNPNPFNQSTVIRFTVPKNYSSAQLVVTSVDGKSVRTYAINGSGAGEITINANELAAGSYSYSLNVNGKVIDTKSLVLTK
ncbi:MAG: tail fiber domain-containing protein [Bacteroidia bacterium]